MINITRTRKSLKLTIDGVEKTISYPVDQLDDYRALIGLLKQHKEMVEGDQEEVVVVDQAFALLEGCREIVRKMVGEEQFTDAFGSVGDDIPFMGWLAIIKAIQSDMDEYLSSTVGTEGEL